MKSLESKIMTDPDRDRKSRISRHLVWAIGIGLLLRLILMVLVYERSGPDGFLVFDSGGYLQLAESLSAGKGFIDAFGRAEIFRTPGYPLLLAPGAAIGQPVLFALLIQLLMTAAIVAMTYAIARIVTRDDRLAGLCAIVAAIEPTMLAWSLQVMPETLLTLCLLCFAYATLRALETHRLSSVIAAAIALCIAAYVKPIVYPFVFVACLAAFLRPRIAVPFLVTCAMLLVPWHVRNHQRTGYAAFSTVMARMVYLSAGGAILAEREHRPFVEVRRELLRKEDVDGATADPKRYAREGAEIVASDPVGYAKTHVLRMLRTLVQPGATEYLRMLDLYHGEGLASPAFANTRATVRAHPLAFWSSLILGIALLPLVLLPFVGAYRSPSAAFLLLAAISAYLVFASGGVPGHSRFRAPAVPFLIVMSAVAFARPRACAES